MDPDIPGASPMLILLLFFSNFKIPCTSSAFTCILNGANNLTPIAHFTHFFASETKDEREKMVN